jgi:hypothetical protein
MVLDDLYRPEIVQESLQFFAVVLPSPLLLLAETETTDPPFLPPTSLLVFYFLLPVLYCIVHSRLYSLEGGVRTNSEHMTEKSPEMNDGWSMAFHESWT